MAFTCNDCGGWYLAKPLCGGMGVKVPKHRCRCHDSSTSKVAWAMAWLAFFVNPTITMPPDEDR